MKTDPTLPNKPFYYGMIILFCLIITCMIGCPRYNVYRQRMAGEAQLAEAVSNRQIAIQEAHAKMEAAKDLAEAEIIRAQA